jgi:hypothetical protein
MADIEQRMGDSLLQRPVLEEFRLHLVTRLSAGATIAVARTSVKSRPGNS